MCRGGGSGGGRVCARTWRNARARNNPFIIYYFSWLRKAMGHKENAHAPCGVVAVLLRIFTNWKIMLTRKGWTGRSERASASSSNPERAVVAAGVRNVKPKTIP